LGSASARVRERAEEDLVALGVAAIDALEKASSGGNEARAKAAKRALHRILRFTVEVVDAVGKPIGGGEVELAIQVPVPESLTPVPVPGEEAATKIERLVFRSTSRGHVPLVGSFELQREARIVVSHPEYGRAIGVYTFEGERHRVQAPLVRRGTVEHERALSGVVVDPEGSAVPNAAVRCRDVRTPGE